MNIFDVSANTANVILRLNECGGYQRVCVCVCVCVAVSVYGIWYKLNQYIDITNIANLKNEKTQFTVALKRYLNAHSFYSVDEFLACTDDL
jgi:hypothetical protein